MNRCRVLAAAACLILTLAGCAAGARAPARSARLVRGTAAAPAADPAAAARVSAGEQALSLALLRELAGRGNLAVSPFSLYVALAMLADGAAGTTATQLRRLLGGPDTGQRNAGLATLTAGIGAAARRAAITLQSADALWLQRGFPVRAGFLAALARYFDTGVWQADFRGDPAAALRAIDGWTSRATHGKITKLFDRLDPSTVLVLANAVYLAARWAIPFDPAQTEPGPFTTAAGRSLRGSWSAARVCRARSPAATRRCSCPTPAAGSPRWRSCPHTARRPTSSAASRRRG